ncbi:MAG: hypothetical protein ACO1N0_05275 [Fluviicola sp.]
MEIAEKFWHQALFEKDNHLSDSLRNEIIEIGPANLLIYLFNHYNGAAAMYSCLLMLFPFWKNFSFSEWEEIFRSVTDKNSGQYYLNQNIRSLLGINPGFSKYQEEKPVTISFTDMKIAIGMAIFEQEGLLRKRFENQLIDYGITLIELENISDRLILEGAQSIRGTGTTNSL